MYQGGLGDFDTNHMARALIFLHEPFYDGQRIGVVKIHAGQIDRKRQRFSAIMQMMDNPLYGLFYHIIVQPGNESRLFQERNILPGHNHSSLRIHPAGQGFQSAYLAGTYPDLRLKIYLEIFLFQRFFKMAHQIAAVHQFFSHHIIVFRIKPGGIFFDGIGSHFGQIEQVIPEIISCCGLIIAGDKQSGLEFHRGILYILAYRLMQDVKLFQHTVFIGKQGEMITPLHDR